MSLRIASRLWISSRTRACWPPCSLPPRDIPARVAKPHAITRPRCAPIAGPDEKCRRMRAVGVLVDRRRGNPRPAASCPSAFTTARNCRTRTSISPARFPSRSPATSSISCCRTETLGLFDIETAAREQGSWVGYGKHLPMPKAKPAPRQIAKIDQDNDSRATSPCCTASIPPVIRVGKQQLRRFGTTGPDPNAPPPDPDRPTLHKGGDASSDNSGNSSTLSSGSSSSNLPDSSSPTASRWRCVRR